MAEVTTESKGGGGCESGVPRSADRSVIKRRSIESVSAAIFANPGEAKKRPCKTHARWSAKIKAESGKEGPADVVSADAGKFAFPKHGRRGSKKFKRRFFSQNVAGASASGGVRRRGPRRLSGSNNAPFNSTQFLMNDRGSESIRYLDDKLVRAI